VVHSFGDRARQHILQHYSWDKVAESTAELYRSMLA
jgi:glycosyltransferase involved in cell wall biosynthesis